MNLTDDATPSADQQPNDTAVRRRVALLCILVGLAILAYVVPDVFAGLRARDAAAKAFRSYRGAIEAPSESYLSDYAHTARAQNWRLYQASVTRVRIDGVIGFPGGVSLSAGLTAFLTKRNDGNS